MALVFLVALCFRGHPADRALTRTIYVLVFDYAGVPEKILEPGLRESKRIMESAGVDLVWIACPVAPERLAMERSCRDAPGPLTLMLHILDRRATRRQTEPAAFGFAVQPENGGFGTYAGVFYERVEKLGATISKAASLGHVIAHELGHLLLGTGQHSAGGIMKADWRSEQLELAAQGSIRFDQAERRCILSNIRRRLAAAEATRDQTAARQGSSGPNPRESARNPAMRARVVGKLRRGSRPDDCPSSRDDTLGQRFPILLPEVVGHGPASSRRTRRPPCETVARVVNEIVGMTAIETMHTKRRFPNEVPSYSVTTLDSGAEHL